MHECEAGFNNKYCPTDLIAGADWGKERGTTAKIYLGWQAFSQILFSPL